MLSNYYKGMLINPLQSDIKSNLRKTYKKWRIRKKNCMKTKKSQILLSRLQSCQIFMISKKSRVQKFLEVDKTV